MKKKNIILNSLIAIFLAVALFSGYKLFGIHQEAEKSANDFEHLQQITDEKDENGNATYSSAEEKYASVLEKNNDFVAWINIPETPLNYPVVQTKNSPEYYLHKDFEGNYSAYGVPFMDYRDTADVSDNIIVYGHNMTNKTMFSAVESYADKNYWKEHKYIGFDTMNGFGTYEVVVSFRINTRDTNFYYSEITDFANADEFNSYINNAKALATYDTGVKTSYGDKLLTLSTCEYTYPDGAGRYVLIAKKISNEDITQMNIAE